MCRCMGLRPRLSPWRLEDEAGLEELVDEAAHDARRTHEAGQLGPETGCFDRIR